MELACFYRKIARASPFFSLIKIDNLHCKHACLSQSSVYLCDPRSQRCKWGLWKALIVRTEPTKTVGEPKNTEGVLGLVCTEGVTKEGGVTDQGLHAVESPVRILDDQGALGASPSRREYD